VQLLPSKRTQRYGPAIPTGPSLEGAMASRIPQQQDHPGQLADLLDQLVSVDLDLEPICRMGADPAQLATAADSISSACDTLRAAIRDLRGIVHQMDGGRYLAPPIPIRSGNERDTGK
jgi:hypothetical protein